MIYLDNAATSLGKPACVGEAVAAAIKNCANPARGAYEPALQAARTVHEARVLLAKLFNAEAPSRIAFTHNATYALNMALYGLLQAGDHVITSVCEHNSVLRPLYALEQQGVQVTHLDCDDYGRIDYDAFARFLRPNTKAVVLAHASNVTGNITDLGRVSRFTKAHKLLLIVDAAQTAGCYPIDVQQLGIDVLCFTGHKSLLGPQGVGGLYVRSGLAVRSLITGGSGVQSFSKTHPAQMPTALEAGTLNAAGIAGLRAALQFCSGNEKFSPAAIHAHEAKLAQRFADGIRDVKKIKIYGDFRSGSERVGIVTLNLGTLDAGIFSDALWENFQICTRAGAHCAPLLHHALGTQEQGAVRFSFGAFNTLEETDAAVAAVRALGEAYADEA